MRIDEALTQVRAMQMQLARCEPDCCYRWATVATSGVMAFVAAGVQHHWIMDAGQQPLLFLILWIAVAMFSVATIGAEMLVRWLRSDSEYARRHTILAVQQFVPCLVVGALVTWGIQVHCPHHAELYPALWAMLFSLGIYSSREYLPKRTILIAGYYLAASLVCLRWGQADQALRPWTMVVSFGMGQLITSAILYRCQERERE